MSIHRWMDKEYMQWERMKYHRGNMDGPRGNYTDWNISYKER